MIYAEVENVIFKKQNISWNDVEVYLKKYIGLGVTVENRFSL